MSPQLEHFIWSMQTPALRYQPLAPSSSWVGTIQQDLINYGEEMKLEFPVQEFPAYPFAVAILMVKNEAGIISENLWWLYFIGVRKFIVINNNSTDNTGELIKGFQKYADGVEVVIVDDPVVAHYQAEKTTAAYCMANLIWPEVKWVLPVDADEFLVPLNSLQILDKIPEHVESLVISKVIHCHYNFYKPGEKQTNFLEEMAYRCPLFAVPPKIIVRAHLDIGIAQGNHSIKKKNMQAPIYMGGLGFGLYIREYPNRSFEYFLDKIRNGARAIMEAKKKYPDKSIGGDHWLEYYAIYQEKGLEGLLAIYRDNFIRPLTAGWKLEPFTGVPLEHPYQFFLKRDRIR